MKTLVKVVRDIPWIPQPGEGRLYITDEMPPPEVCSTGCAFVFQGDRVLLTRLRSRDWDIPGGAIDQGETPQQAAVRETCEETCADVEIIEQLGVQELETRGPKPALYYWPYPLSVQVYFLCRLLRLQPFRANQESRERDFFTPEQARQVPTMENHDAIYEEALRRAIRTR